MAIKVLVNSLFGGGAELQAAQLSFALDAELIILEQAFSKRTIRGFEYTVLGGRPPYFPSRADFLLTERFAERLAARTSEKDTVLSFMAKSNFINVAAARISGHRAIIGEITQPSREYRGLRGLIMRPLIRKYYPMADIVVANSNGNANDLKENFGITESRLRVINNLCDIAYIRSLAGKNFSDEFDPEMANALEKFFKNPVIITAGRLTEAKGHWHLIRIFAEIKKTVPDLKLFILGDGYFKSELLHLSKRLGLFCCEFEKTEKKSQNSKNENFLQNLKKSNSDIVFAGFQKNPFIFLKHAKLFMFPSLWEGLPNAVIEAIACGLPVIASDCASGPREILAPDTDFRQRTSFPEKCPAGILMPPFSPSSFDFGTRISPLEIMWAREAVKLLENEKALADCRMNGLARAMDFSVPNQLRKWKDITS